jgi:phosphoglycolate phosphatase-like HAD superfamily hydrolase
MPGVTVLLEALARRPHAFFLSLLSGNFEEGARTKLEYFDLWRYFRCGAFGDETLDRNALLPTALARAAEYGYVGNDPAKIVVVGDTPHDIAVARAGGVRSLAVATGSCDRATLAAAGADVVLEDFSDLAATIAALEREAE